MIHLTSLFCRPPPTTEIYTLSLHDALPICGTPRPWAACSTPSAMATPASPELKRYRGAVIGAGGVARQSHLPALRDGATDRKSTRLNSSHRCISYAVFCLKKKKQDAAHADA